ncbi:MAG: DUF177 domain-containing protein [Elusimicrobia bacterium]|nr:DUF177 domain-containing protein [Elusimicrobiota bacterium]
MDISRYDIRSLTPQGRWELKTDLEPEMFQDVLEGQAKLDAPLHVDLAFHVKGEVLLYRGFVAGRWELECCRCLAWQTFPYTAKIEGSCPASETILDAAEDVRQALVLALPLKSCCRPDCRGLCLRCGANNNATPCGCPLP